MYACRDSVCNSVTKIDEFHMSLCCEHAVLSLHIAVHAVLTVEVGQARQHFLQDERNEVFTEASPFLVHGSHQVRHRTIGAVLQAGRSMWLVVD